MDVIAAPCGANLSLHWRDVGASTRIKLRSPRSVIRYIYRRRDPRIDRTLGWVLDLKRISNIGGWCRLAGVASWLDHAIIAASGEAFRAVA